MMDIHKASQDKIRALLTADQQTKFDALQAEMREHRGDHGGGQERLHLLRRRSSNVASHLINEEQRRPEEDLSSGLLAWLALLRAPVRLQ